MDAETRSNCNRFNQNRIELYNEISTLRNEIFLIEEKMRTYDQKIRKLESDVRSLEISTIVSDAVPKTGCRGAGYGLIESRAKIELALMQDELNTLKWESNYLPNDLRNAKRALDQAVRNHEITKEKLQELGCN
jgi:chromosome segregation ATPase